MFTDIIEPVPTKLPPVPDQSHKIEALREKWNGEARIVFNEDEQILHLGACTIRKYTTFKTRSAFISEVLDVHAADVGYHPKWRGKAISAIFGIGPAKLYNHFNKLQYKMFVVPHIHILSKIAFSRGRINKGALKQITLHKPVLQEVYQDGLYNILPVVAATGLSPKELRKQLGKASWRVVSNNSLHKNKALIKSHRNNKAGNAFDIPLDVLKVRAELPTTVLQKFAGHTTHTMEHLAAHYKGQWGKPSNNTLGIIHLVNDTKRLAELLEQPFDPLWTPRRMKEEHDRMAKEKNAQQYSPAYLPVLDGVGVKIFEHEGYVATLLDSKMLIANEGTEMGHCVGLYAGSVASGNYLVYSVAKDGVKSSTIGITVRTSNEKLFTKYQFQQHYGRFNARLTDEREIDISQLIIEQLNKKDEDEKV